MSKIRDEVQYVLRTAEGDIETRMILAIEQARMIMSSKPSKRAMQEDELVGTVEQSLVNHQLNSSYEGILTKFNKDKVQKGGLASSSDDLGFLSENDDDDSLDLPFPAPLFSKLAQSDQEHQQRVHKINSTLNQSFEHIVTRLK